VIFEKGVVRITAVDWVARRTAEIIGWEVRILVLPQKSKDMKFTFGFYNGCYWLIISTAKQLEFALAHMKMTQQNVDVYVEALSNYKAIYLNEAGGYHTGRIQDVHTEKTQLIVKDNSRFPTKMDRVEVMKVELLKEINEIEKELSLPLTSELVL
jgi:hypothetical protein